MHLGGGAAPSPQPPSSLFLLKVASSHCHIASKNITKKKHKKKTKNNKKKQHMQRHPMHLGGDALRPPHKKWQNKKHKCKDTQSIFRRTLQKETRNAKTPDAFPSCNLFVLKLPCKLMQKTPGKPAPSQKKNVVLMRKTPRYSLKCPHRS